MRLNSHPNKFDWVFVLQWVLVTTCGWIVGVTYLGDLGVGIPVGLFQWLILRLKIDTGVTWLITTSIGWLIPAVIILTIFPHGISGLATVFISLSIGLAQWLVLRKQLMQAWWWIPASGASWFIALSGIWGILFAGAFVGLITGLVLELLVRFSYKMD